MTKKLYSGKQKKLLNILDLLCKIPGPSMPNRSDPGYLRITGETLFQETFLPILKICRVK